MEKYWKHKQYANKGSMNRVWVEIDKNIFKEEKVLGHSKKRYFNFSLFAKVAASAILFMLGYYHFYLLPPKNVEVEDVAQISRENKIGEKRTIKLSDGTVIILNAESKLKFPERFTQDIREVFLEGEAFFDVAKDESHPFIIHTQQLNITVKGTSFNVKAYKDENNIKVSVVTGLVEVSNGEEVKLLLEPSDKGVYNKKKNSIVKKTFSPDEIVWSKGILFFENVDFNELVDQLEQWYGVEFIVQKGNISSKKSFKGRFENESLEEVLENISFAGKFDFEIKGKKVIIK
ncbi:FecR domain-containing protein [Flammeovirgaceae bacterium SG7u.111]|nr:FecR domain-containing protein [Flammeovirgaceae bacterium SG7u.132]WPO38427.1 FecR domain-containing protein [Flammeovirgaceae bacterium SG7u.111]